MTNTSLCYIQHADSYLMLHRTKKQNDYNKDKWIGIGGKFEEQEAPEDCVCREVKEETGIVMNRKFLEYRGIITFICRNKGEEPYTEFMHLFWYDFDGAEKPECGKDFSFAGDECSEGELEWVPIAKMNELPHWKGDEIFLEYLKQKIPFFSLKLEYEDGELVTYVSSVDS